MSRQLQFDLGDLRVRELLVALADDLRTLAVGASTESVSKDRVALASSLQSLSGLRGRSTPRPSPRRLRFPSLPFETLELTPGGTAQEQLR